MIVPGGFHLSIENVGDALCGVPAEQDCEYTYRVELPENEMKAIDILLQKQYS